MSKSELSRSCGADNCSLDETGAASRHQAFTTQGIDCCKGNRKFSRRCLRSSSQGRGTPKSPESDGQVAFSSRFRVPKLHRLLPLMVVLLLSANLSQRSPEGCRNAPSEPSLTETDGILFTLVHRWLTPVIGASTASFGLIYASAAPCAVNICNTGTCYEHLTAQICVCPLPFRGPTCSEKASLCTQDCGIRSTSGLDCSSALCSLGACVDTDVSPYYKCECGDFFQGTNCEVPTNPCTGAVNPCGQGTCIFAPGRGTGTVTCRCYDDWEVAPGAGVVTTKWGSSELVMNPPCTVRVSRGLAKISFTLSSGELIVWWTVFAAVLCILLWCCYSVAMETCGNCLKKLKLAGQIQKAAGS